jgi:hypothetical protein
MTPPLPAALFALTRRTSAALASAVMRGALVLTLLLGGCAYTPLRTHGLDGLPLREEDQPNTVHLQDGQATGTAIAVAAWAALEQFVLPQPKKAPPAEPQYGPCGPACGPVPPPIP